MDLADFSLSIFKDFQVHIFAVLIYIGKKMVSMSKEMAVTTERYNGLINELRKDVDSNTGKIDIIENSHNKLTRIVIRLRDKFDK